jgi:transglutaminase-like putative cysteine protease
MRSHRKVRLSLVLAVLLFLLLSTTLPAYAQQVGVATDPFGRPLAPRDQQRARLEQLLGRHIVDNLPIQRGPLAEAKDPFDGPDVSVAFTLSDAGTLAKVTPGDLAETPEVKFTPEVKAIVASLGSDPAQLYLYVKNGCVFTPYVGSQKGSQGTADELAGNDFDQASLLIALLRAAGTPARYAFGSMLIPTSAALNWLGVDSPAAALRVLQFQGVPAQFVNTGGGSLKVDRVWVQAFIDRNGPNPRWVPLDPAFKQYQVTPASPLATSVAFDESAYLNLPITDRRTPYEFLASNLQAHLDSVAPGATVDDVVRTSTIIDTVLPKGIPGRLENHARTSGEASELTDTQRYLVGVATVDAQGLSAQATFRLPEIYGQRLTVSFPPATAADQALVQSFGGYYKTPADQLHVAASIAVNGQIVATGSRAVSIGDGHFVVVDLLFPGATQPATLFHTVFAGGFYALGLDAQGDLASEIAGRQQASLDAQLTSTDPTYDDSTTGNFLSSDALVYLNNVQSERLKIGALFSGTQVMDVSEALTMQNIRIEFVNGVLQFRPLGYTIDAQRVAGRLFSDNGDDSDAPTLAQIAGLGSSLLESRLWDTFSGLQSISTTRGLQVANAESIPIYHIDQTNIATLVPTMNVFPDVLQNVVNEVNAGFNVTIPRDTIILNQWAGSTWIEQSPDGLSAAYLIEGGLFGGSTTQDPKNRNNTNPNCTDLDTTFDAASGNFNSDFDRAVAFQESRWTQFDASGDPKTLENTNGTDDIGIMQVNDSHDGESITLPDGTKVTVSIPQLQNDPTYNIQVGAAILNNALQRAQTYLQGLGVANPADADLLTEAYYIYNHGSNKPPGFAYDANGNLVKIDYTGNPKVGKGAKDAQNNALHVRDIFNNQSWLTGRKGCQGPL